MHRSRLAAFSAAVAAGLLAACASAPLPPAGTEADVYYRYERAMNRGDLEGIMALVADDATFDNPGRCRPNPCRGKEVIRSFIKETAIDVNGRLKTIDVKSRPGEVDARVEFTSEKVRGSGIDRIVGNERWKVGDGKIKVFEFAIDGSDAQSKAYIGSLQHAAAQEAARRASARQPRQ